MTTRVLILCTHNSARSVLGETMLNHLAGKPLEQALTAAGLAVGATWRHRATSCTQRHFKILTTMHPNYLVRLLSELLGTALLLCVVIGSGVMGVNLAQGNDAIALLANTLATVFGLYVLIELFGPIGGGIWLGGGLAIAVYQLMKANSNAKQ